MGAKTWWCSISHLEQGSPLKSLLLSKKSTIMLLDFTTETNSKMNETQHNIHKSFGLNHAEFHSIKPHLKIHKLAPTSANDSKSNNLILKATKNAGNMLLVGFPIF